ncbi:MAG: ribbon-helix-helix domain-containing protein [Candidatus Bathyarchaeia archaeon]
MKEGYKLCAIYSTRLLYGAAMHSCVMNGGKRPGLKRTYLTVSIPRELIEEIDRAISVGKYGYDSRAEFIKDAIRRRLEELKPLR